MKALALLEPELHMFVLLITQALGFELRSSWAHNHPATSPARRVFLLLHFVLLCSLAVSPVPEDEGEKQVKQEDKERE